MVNINNTAKSWKERVLSADNIWAQVKDILANHQVELPKTPRRPDLRLILKNVTGTTQIFRNPGDHSNKAEAVPAEGNKTAAMVMLKGDSLGEQLWAARELCKRYNLESEGLSSNLVQAIANQNEPLIKEAYGPAPFEEQAGRLVTLDWVDNYTHEILGTPQSKRITIEPSITDVCAYGVRNPETEAAMRAEFAVMVKGTSTVPERIDNEGIVIAVTEDWKTKGTSTRPIAPAVARTFYGAHYDAIPVITLHPDELVMRIDLKNAAQEIIEVEPPAGYEDLALSS